MMVTTSDIDINILFSRYLAQAESAKILNPEDNNPKSGVLRNIRL